MPPRRRKRNATESAAASAPPSPSSVPERSPQGSDAEPTSPGIAPSHDGSELPRFYNTTFTTYRVSPLYLGQQALTPARLQLLSKRLRDALVGDVVRGVQVGLENDAALGRTGALYAVEWRWIDAEQIVGGNSRREGSVELGNDAEEAGERVPEGAKKVLCVELKYENARFSALLLSDLAGDEDARSSSHQPSWAWQTDHDDSRMGGADQSAFLHLPLLLFRMPAPLKSVLIDFLSNTFDCRINPLALGTQTLVGSWEAWLSDNSSRRNRRPLSKDVLITLGFHIEPPEAGIKVRGDGNTTGGGTTAAEENQGQNREFPPAGLKTIDITIPAVDTHRFLRVGEKLDGRSTTIARKRKTDAKTTLSDEQQSRRRRKLAGGKDEEGWAWRSQDDGGAEEGGKGREEQPFTEALAAYVWHHLGLDMFHPGVRVQRVACDGFALSEGRLKVFAPANKGAREYKDDHDDQQQDSAAWKLVRGLVRRARGKPGWGSDTMARLIAQ